jgi:hypothetical protein
MITINKTLVVAAIQLVAVPTLSSEIVHSIASHRSVMAAWRKLLIVFLVVVNQGSEPMKSTPPVKRVG